MSKEYLETRTASISRYEWAARYGLTPATPSHVCLRWIATRGRCRRYCSPFSGWWDHVSAWKRDGKPAVLLLQPYAFEHHYTALSAALVVYPQVFLRFERGGWHHPSTALVELWADEATYREARGALVGVGVGR